jgi:hypothetical protein
MASLLIKAILIGHNLLKAGKDMFQHENSNE